MGMNSDLDMPSDDIVVVTAKKAITSSISMAFMFVLGLALIQILFKRSTENVDEIVKALEYSALASGYCLLALPAWGIFDTLKRTRLYLEGPKFVIALGYIAIMSSFLYSSYQGVIWFLRIYLH